MRGRETLMSHKSDEWETPRELFDELDKEFDFDLDVCATSQNTQCVRFFDMSDDGLVQDWGNATVWCNPPYSNIKAWAAKCSKHNGIAVMLLPARTDTLWFHDYCYNKPNSEVRFIKGRLRFSGTSKDATFPSMLVIFRNGETPRKD